LPWQRSLGDRKTNFRLIIYSHSSAKPEKLAKIGPVDVEINGLRETKAERKPAFAAAGQVLLSGIRQSA